MGGASRAQPFRIQYNDVVSFVPAATRLIDLERRCKLDLEKTVLAWHDDALNAHVAGTFRY